MPTNSICVNNFGFFLWRASKVFCIWSAILSSVFIFEFEFSLICWICLHHQSTSRLDFTAVHLHYRAWNREKSWVFTWFDGLTLPHPQTLNVMLIYLLRFIFLGKTSICVFICAPNFMFLLIIITLFSVNSWNKSTSFMRCFRLYVNICVSHANYRVHVKIQRDALHSSIEMRMREKTKQIKA